MALASAGGGGREVPQEEGGTHEESSGHFDEAQRRTRPRESAEEGQSVIEEEETAAGTPVTAQWLEGVRLKERLGLRESLAGAHGLLAANPGRLSWAGAVAANGRRWR